MCDKGNKCLVDRLLSCLYAGEIDFSFLFRRNEYSDSVYFTLRSFIEFGYLLEQSLKFISG